MVVSNRFLISLAVASACSAISCQPASKRDAQPANATPAAAKSVALANDAYHVRLEADGAVTVSRGADGVGARFEPRFTVFATDRDPQPALRWGKFDERKEEMFYNVMTWDRGAGPTMQAAASDKAAAAATTQHVEDGYDPKSDRGVDANRSPNLFRAAPSTDLIGKASASGDAIAWAFDEQPDYKLAATLTVPRGVGEPTLTVTLTPKTAKFYSVGYTGAPTTEYAAVQDLYQPMIWQERRWPTTSVLTEAFRAPLPTCFVTAAGVTTGVVADPKELPFQPLPTLANSTFGIALRTADNKARPMLFAPILGHAKSKMTPSEDFAFAMRLFVGRGDTTAAFEQVARGLYGLRDLRRNGPVTLNETFENTLAFAMGPHAHFNDLLRGAAYETDVPGAVKNVTALHPLGVALVTDDATVFETRARPMIEYSASRERFLFAIDPKIKGQGVSTKLTGPGVPLSDVAALYALSGRLSPVLLGLAESVYPRTRILNLESEMHGDAWHNDLALYRATRDKAWLNKAIAKADAYIASRVDTAQTDFNDRDSRGMFFWTSYAPNFVELFELYETTDERRFLDAAQRSARRYAQFIWASPAVPDGDVRVNQEGIAPLYRNSPRFKPIKVEPETVPAWRLSEIGLTSESSGTCKGHRAIFLASPAPTLLRIARASGDAFLHDLARGAVVGRSASFPGYHINTARTTAYEKVDYAERPLAELNSTTSLHYNHIWPHVAMLLDYLVSDAVTKSAGAIDFPSQYAEGYAYMQGKVYGGAPGTFYGDKDVSLWMPAGLVDAGHGELNYVAARGNGQLYVALTNQSDQEIKTMVRIDGKQLPPGSVGKSVRVWRENKPVDGATMDGRGVEVTVAPKGITAVAIDGLDVRPTFQQRVGGGQPWRVDSAPVPVGDGKAMILNFGPTLTSAYVYLQTNGEVFKSVRLTYRTPAGERSIVDDAFPFEWTVPLAESDAAFEFRIEATPTTTAPASRTTTRPTEWIRLSK